MEQPEHTTFTPGGNTGVNPFANPSPELERQFAGQIAVIDGVGGALLLLQNVCGIRLNDDQLAKAKSIANVVAPLDDELTILRLADALGEESDLAEFAAAIRDIQVRSLTDAEAIKLAFQDNIHQVDP